MPHRVLVARRRDGSAIRPAPFLCGGLLLTAAAAVIGCAPAETSPRSSLGSVVVEPELTPDAVGPLRGWVPDVITPPRPFQSSAAANAAPAAGSTLAESRRPLDLPSAVRLAAVDVPEPAVFPATDTTPQTAEIRDMLTGYLQAFNRHDATAAADHWTAAGENVNLTSGEVTRGREAVREVFAALFDLDAEATIDLDVSSIRSLHDDVAVVDGLSRVSYADGEVAGSRFSAVVVRGEGGWKLASVRETPCDVAATPGRPLEALAWLVGSWENVGGGVTASGRANWTGDRAFLTRHHLVAPGEDAAPAPSAGDTRIPGLLATGVTARRELTEIIAWDPEREAIRSWIFSSDGRFAEATWSREGDAWLVEVEGRGVDAGRTATARLASDGPDGLVVSSDGEALAGLLPPACRFTRTAR